jgi:hypothetical protein
VRTLWSFATKLERVPPLRRIVIRHRSGTKANGVADVPLPGMREIQIGRDTSASIRFDADREDLASRNHARVVREPPDQNVFTINDLEVRDGIFLSRRRWYGASRQQHGDRIQLGPAGPEIAFDSRPESLGSLVPPARQETIPGLAMPSRPISSRAMTGHGAAAGSDTSRPVKLATVERMPSDLTPRLRGESRRTLRAAVIGMAAMLVPGTRYFVYGVLATSGTRCEGAGRHMDRTMDNGFCYECRQQRGPGFQYERPGCGHPLAVRLSCYPDPLRTELTTNAPIIG